MISNPAIPSRVFAADGLRIVGGAIIANQQFKILICLVQNAVQSARQELLAIVGDQYYAYVGTHIYRDSWA